MIITKIIKLITSSQYQYVSYKYNTKQLTMIILIIIIVAARRDEVAACQKFQVPMVPEHTHQHLALHTTYVCMCTNHEI